MLKREWQKIFKNKWMIVILLAIITIPAVYTSVFLGSMWDPYGDMDELPVAVVNHDRKITYEGQELAVGDALADNLKKSGSLDFHFVSDEKAEKGLKDGSYYMIISIPENFSKNAATLMDENPKQMKLTYKTNPGTNYIASKMDDSAMAKIEKSVSEQVTETYAETIFAQIKKAGSGMAQAADGAAQVKDGARALSDGNTKIEKNLEKLASSSLVFQNGADTLKVIHRWSRNSGIRSGRPGSRRRTAAKWSSFSAGRGRTAAERFSVSGFRNLPVYWRSQPGSGRNRHNRSRRQSAESRSSGAFFRNTGIEKSGRTGTGWSPGNVFPAGSDDAVTGTD